MAPDKAPARVNEPLLGPPPVAPGDMQGRWTPLPPGDPVAERLASRHRRSPAPPEAWQATRLSNAVYLYRETGSGETWAAKFYTVKTGDAAPRYAQQEYDLTRLAERFFREGEAFRSVEALDVWRGVLLLEYVPGLTLEDVIAVRRHRPDALGPALEQTARLLAHLHTTGAGQPPPAPGVKVYERSYAEQVTATHERVATLAEFGVLQGTPLARQALDRLIERWAEDEAMQAGSPVFSHGDATTSNFIFPESGPVTAIDWERACLADPAADLGRLLAEVAHSVQQHGGSLAEAQPLTERVAGVYLGCLPSRWEAEALLGRARFYQAGSTLRIARNGWLDERQRLELVAEGFGLLTV